MRYGTDSRASIGLRLTPAVKWLILINVGVFVLLLILGRVLGEGAVHWVYSHLAVSFSGVFSRGEVWQPLTYLFLHDAYEISHILWNMLMLWMFGSPLEALWGRHRFLRFYLLTGVLAAGLVLAAGALWPARRELPTLGASGALYALLIAFGFTYPRTPIYLFGLFPILGKYLVLLFVGLGLLQSLTLSASEVSLAAHLGGLLAGLVLITGAWRPRMLLGYLRLGWWKLRYLRLRRKIRPAEDRERWRH